MDPHAKPLTRMPIDMIDKSLFVGITVSSGICILLTGIHIFLAVKYREKEVIKTASWNLNFVMCFGSILGCLCAITFGFDERWFGSDRLDFTCNFNLWILVLSFTLVYAPMFAKMYRLSKVFSKVFASPPPFSLFPLLFFSFFTPLIFLRSITKT